MTENTEIWVPVLTAFLGLIGGVVTALASLRSERRRLRDELEVQREALRAEFGTEESVESALRHFLGIYHLPYRSFPMIRHHVGGFEKNELRRLLVRAGAVRFMAQDGTELWAMRERVADHFKNGRWKHPESPNNKQTESDLFPGAFGNDTDN